MRTGSDDSVSVTSPDNARTLDTGVAVGDLDGGGTGSWVKDSDLFVSAGLEMTDGGRG
jgi:hypothetical protein